MPAPETAADRRHIAVLAFPFGTHAAPLLSLAQRLAEAAPEATFSFFTTASSKRSLAAADSFRRGVEAAARERGEVSCVVSDSFIWMGSEVAEELGVPWVAVWTSGLCSLAAHFHTDLIRGIVGEEPDVVTRRLDESLTFVPGLAQFRLRDLPEGIVFGPLHSPISLLLHRMAQVLPRAKVVVIGTIDGVDPIDTVENMMKSLQRCLLVGPLNLWSPTPPESDPDSCLAWLDSLAHSPASVAYVAFGTVASPPLHELAQLAHGLEASGVHFLWALKEGLREEALPRGFLERTRGRGIIVSWAPQRRVLGHVAMGAFLTHCGWNSVMEGIASGVPMICRPFFGDQRLNQQLISHVMGIGVGVEGGALTKEGIMDALDMMLHKDEGKMMREKAGVYKELVKDAVCEVGTCTKNLKSLIDVVI